MKQCWVLSAKGPHHPGNLCSRKPLSVTQGMLFSFSTPGKLVADGEDFSLSSLNLRGAHA